MLNTQKKRPWRVVPQFSRGYTYFPEFWPSNSLTGMSEDEEDLDVDDSHTNWGEEGIGERRERLVEAITQAILDELYRY